MLIHILRGDNAFISIFFYDFGIKIIENSIIFMINLFIYYSHYCCSCETCKTPFLHRRMIDNENDILDR